VGEPWDEIRDPPVLSIGASVGGVRPEPRAWGDAISRLTRRVVDARSGVHSDLNVNVVFHVPGEVLGVEGDYVRTGSYDYRARLLLVQATVPEALSDDPDRYVFCRLAEAVSKAEEWVRSRGVADSLPGLHIILDRLR